MESVIYGSYSRAKVLSEAEDGPLPMTYSSRRVVLRTEFALGTSEGPSGTKDDMRTTREMATLVGYRVIYVSQGI